MELFLFDIFSKAEMLLFTVDKIKRYESITSLFIYVFSTFFIVIIIADS